MSSIGSDRRNPDRPPGGGRAAGRDPSRVLGLLVAALGALNFIWGFLPEVSSGRSSATLSVFAVGPAYVPILLLIAGLLALAAFLPGTEASRLGVAAVSVGGAAGAIVSLGVGQTATTESKGAGAVLLVIFGIIQAVVAVGAYVVGAGGAPRSWTSEQVGMPAPPAGWRPVRAAAGPPGLTGSAAPGGPTAWAVSTQAGPGVVQPGWHPRNQPFDPPTDPGFAVPVPPGGPGRPVRPTDDPPTDPGFAVPVPNAGGPEPSADSGAERSS